MQTMAGLVAYPDGRHRLEEVPVPRIGENPFAPYDVLVEVELCGVCGSDVHKWTAEDRDGVQNPPRPVVIGHEIVSVVREIGNQVTRVKPGDRVVHEIVTFYCGRCPACLEGRFNICNTVPPMAGRAHMVTGGGFARYAVWPEAQLHRLPDTIGSKAAVLMEPTAGSVHSVVSRMGVRPGESVAVLGPGARGILLTQVCRAIGAGPIIVTGLTRDEPLRLAMARELGADAIVNVEQEDLPQRIRDLTRGIGVDVVLENSGSIEPIEQSLDIVRKGGRVLWAGGGIRGGIKASIDTQKIIVKELDVKGEISQIPYDWRTAIHLVETGRIELERLVTHTFPLIEWHKAFDLAATSPECLRVALVPQ
jgi:2-desacetyl-2-hydroxyethyl bacteriochlorophyllide A dehydrogenase